MIENKKDKLSKMKKLILEISNFPHIVKIKNS